MKRLISIILCIILILSSFAGCSSKPSVPTVRIAGVMNSPSAFLSHMLEKSEGDNEYVYTSVNLPNRIRTLLTDGECDVAVIPVDTACNIYKRANPKIKVIAGISVGGFELVSSKEISSLSELKGKTVHLTERDTLMASIFEFLLERYGLAVHYDVKFEYADDMVRLKESFKNKEAEFALLTSAEATMLKAEIKGLKSYNITDELAKKFKTPSIITYCVVGTSDFIKNNPKIISTLLKDIKASVSKFKKPKERVNLIELGKKHNILTDDIYGEEFLLACKPSFISGMAMKEKLTAYFEFIGKFKPSLVSKVINKNDFFCIFKSDSKNSSKTSSKTSSKASSKVAAASAAET